MNVRVLGCAGSIAAGSHTTAFLVDNDLLVDAGSGVGELRLDELERIDDIVVSHSHLDHVLAIPLLADSVMRRRLAAGRGPIRVHGLAQTLRALKDHLFNGVLWPDFTRLPTPESPILALHPFSVGQTLRLGARSVTVLPAAHTVPAVGFAISAGDGAPAWVFSGDTGPNPAFWQALAGIKIAHLVIETAFSDEEAELATLSQHLSPSALAGELAQLPGCVDVYITHAKPGEGEVVMAQIAALALPHRINALHGGQRFHLE